jgi:hypothetical protein
MKINNKEYKIKVTLRAMMIFEQLTGKPFSISGLLDQYIYFYSIILANNKDFTYTFDEFIDYLDEHPELISEFNEALTNYSKLLGQFNGEEKDDSKKKV